MHDLDEVNVFSKKNIIEEALKKYAGRFIYNKIINDPKKYLTLGMEKNKLSISFYSLNNLAKLSGYLDIERVITIFNQFYDSVITSVEDNNGIIITINGDELIAVHGMINENHEYDSCKSSFETEKLFQTYLIEHNISKLQLLSVGINSGDIIIGNIGNKNRYFYSIMGYNVNLAARLNSLNKIYSTNKIISEFTMCKLNNKAIYRELDNILVMGLNHPVTIYELIDIL